MKGVLLGRRAGTLQRHQVLLFEDRMEDMALRLDGLEVRRLFFDEAQCATVHRRRPILELITGTLVSLVLVIGAYLARTAPPMAISFGAAGLVTALFTALAVVYPRHLLVVRAPDQKLEIPLSRWAARRKRTLQRVVDAIAEYQDRHAAAVVAPPAIEVEPSSRAEVASPVAQPQPAIIPPSAAEEPNASTPQEPPPPPLPAPPRLPDRP
jgi:hypothetical protein